MCVFYRPRVYFTVQTKIAIFGNKISFSSEINGAIEVSNSKFTKKYIFTHFRLIYKMSILIAYMQISVCVHAQACPGDLLLPNVCNKTLVTEPIHYYLVLGSFGAIQYNFPGGIPPSTYDGLNITNYRTCKYCF